MDDVKRDVLSRRRICKLSEETTNRIAAGEVIVRPSHALKELIENSLDGGARRITVEVQGGGFHFFQVVDDGVGIHKDDLPVVCLRFTTSKLRTIDDLRSLTSFGFRGEALASLSHVAKVSITTSRAEDRPLAYTCSYINGVPVRPVAAKPGGETAGTTVVAEDLFYNLPVRREALQQSEEYGRILNVVESYALHYPFVAFTCRRRRRTAQSVNPPDLCTSGNVDPLFSQASTFPESTVIRAIHGKPFAESLISFTFSHLPLFSFHGLMSRPGSAVASTKKGAFTLFVNHRLVESNPIKRLVESLFQKINGTVGSSTGPTAPWTYLSIEAPPEALDVNVHPAKKEVVFFHQETLLADLECHLRNVLEACISGCRFAKPALPDVRTLLSPLRILSQNPASQRSETSNHPDDGTCSSHSDPFSQSSLPQTVSDQSASEFFDALKTPTPKPRLQASQAALPKATRPRIDARQVRLDGFMGVTMTSDSKRLTTEYENSLHDSSVAFSCFSDVQKPVSFRDFLISPEPSSQPPCLRLDPTMHPLSTTSEHSAPVQCSENAAVDRLKLLVVQKSSAEATAAWSRSFFVGALDTSLVFLQCDSDLLLVDLPRFVEHAVYQSILHRLGRLPCLEFDPPLQLNMEHLTTHVHTGQDESGTIALEDCVAFLNHYFSIHVDINVRILHQGNANLREVFEKPSSTLSQFPLCCGSYFPSRNGEHVPDLLRRIITNSLVASTKEEVLDSVSHLLAVYFSTLPSLPQPHLTANTQLALIHELFEFVFHPLVNGYPHFAIPATCLEGDRPIIRAISNLGALYRVFERC